MEGERFCGVVDEGEGGAEVTFIFCFQIHLSLAACCSLAQLQFVPIVPFKLQKLSEAMYLDDKEEGMTKFRDLLGYLPAQMVRSLIIDLLYSFGKTVFPDK